MIAHEISYNPDRQSAEILLCLEDVKPSGVSFVAAKNLLDTPVSSGWVHYARPFVDDIARELIVEIGSDPTILNLSTDQAAFHGLTKARVSALLQVIASKVDIPVTVSADATVKFRMGTNTDLLLDGKTAVTARKDSPTQKADETATAPESKKRKLEDGVEPEVEEWKVRAGQWRVRVQQEPAKGGAEIVLVAVKLDAFTCERTRNARRRFLT